MPLRASSFSLTLPHGVPKLTSELAPAHQSFAFALKHKPDAIHTYSAPSVPAPWTAGTTDGRHRHTRASGRPPGQPPRQSGLFAFPFPPTPQSPAQAIARRAAVPQVPRRSCLPTSIQGAPSLPGLTQSPKHSSRVTAPSEAPLTRSCRRHPPGLPARSIRRVSQTALSVCRPCSSFSSPTLKSWKTSSC